MSTDPTVPGATPVSADVPADEPIPPAAVPPPYQPIVPTEPPTPLDPDPAPAPPPFPAPQPFPEPAPFPMPDPDPVPMPEPAPAPMPEPPPAPTGPTIDAGLAAAAATTTEVAPHPAVPSRAAYDDDQPPRSRAAYDDDPPPPSRAAYDDDPPLPSEAAAARRGPALLVPAALLLLGLLGGAAFTWFVLAADGRKAEQLAERRADALGESRQLALNLVSIDYKNLDRDLQRISDSTTGKAREEFDAKILKNDAYKTLVKENEAVLASTIKRIGLEPCGTNDDACLRGDTAVALVFLDQESRNKLRTTPRVDRNRVALTLVRRGDSWLVSEVAVI